MAEVVLFHHVLGLTGGVRALAERLRGAGHTLHVPDLFDGQVAAGIEEGLELVGQIGDEELDARATRVLDALPGAVVYAGVSFGASLAQSAAQTRPGARGALLIEGCLPVSGEWSVGPWPDGVPAQIHGMDADPFFAGEGDIDAAREIVATAGPGLAELFTYPGDRHLFTDSSLPAYDPAAAELVLDRSLAFLGRVG
jgi:dienelactone hydrolase